MKFTDEQLKQAVQQSVSVSEVLRRLGLNSANGSSWAWVKRRINHLELNTSHFLGKRWNQGKEHKGGPKRLTPSELLCYDRREGRREYAYRLRRALLESGISYNCSECGNNGFWNGKPLTLEVDHIDNNRLNNSINNLRFICANCHSQKE